jgi:hypothetical protein
MTSAYRPGRVAAVAAVLGTLAWALWLYAIPLDYTCSWGINLDHAEHFRRALGLPAWRASIPRFREGLAACMAVAWAAYLGLLAIVLAGGAPPRRWTARLALGAGLVLAIVGPPALSSDIYAYVGYARLVVVHHLSPYVETQWTLVQRGDLTSPFLAWPISSPYGPGWTILSIVFVRLWPTSVIGGPIVMFKLLAAGALLALAEGGRRLAERFVPARAEAVFAAIALCPLFLFEGVVSGHNDVVMMALVVWSLVLVEERPRTAFLLLGLAASIKFVPLLLAPWLLTTAARRLPRRAWLLLAARSALLTVAPIIVCFAPFWHGLSTLSGLQARSSQGLHPGGDGFARQGLILLGIYAVLCAWIALGKPRNVLRAWIVASLSVIVFTTGMWFPWYFIWPLSVALILLESPDLASVGVVLGGVFLSLWSYVR